VRTLREAVAFPGSATYSATTLAYALARGGDASHAKDLVGTLEEKMRSDYVSPVELATLHIALGNHDDALDWMDRAFEERRGWMAYLDVHPIVDPVRAHPRFGELITKLGLPSARTRRLQ
jgi:hypothetical protein